MSIQFSGTHVFKMDRPVCGDELQKLGHALYSGITGKFPISAITEDSNATGYGKAQHLMVLQGTTPEQDEVILSNAKKLGVIPDSIDSGGMTFATLKAGSMEAILFREWGKLSGRYFNAVNPVATLLENAAKQEKQRSV